MAQLGNRARRMANVSFAALILEIYMQENNKTAETVTVHTIFDYFGARLSDSEKDSFMFGLRCSIMRRGSPVHWEKKQGRGEFDKERGYAPRQYRVWRVE